MPDPRGHFSPSNHYKLQDVTTQGRETVKCMDYFKYPIAEIDQHFSDLTKHERNVETKEIKIQYTNEKGVMLYDFVHGGNNTS